jgi:uncharacterized protein YunC (DUF1805 family)
MRRGDNLRLHAPSNGRNIAMLHSEVIDIDGASLLGIRVDMPNAPVLMVVGKKGFVGCGYFNPEVADKVSHALAVVSGVASFDDVLAAEVKAVSSAASDLGVSEGMTGAAAARLLA